MIAKPQMPECRNFSEFMQTERDALRRAIAENKWYLSERAGRDVGWDAAKRDFAELVLIEFAVEFRRYFCEERCSHSASCELYATYRDRVDQKLATVHF